MSKEKTTENSGFLDGRDYTAPFLYEFFALLVGNGVYANELAPTATNENMTITHGRGHAWINGVCYKNTTPFVLDIGTADGALNRYDSLMLRLDLSANETYAVIVQGDYATTPTPPACVRNAETYDLKICDIYIPAGCTKITQAQITDRRLDASVCGVPFFPIEHLDMSTFYRQITYDLASFKEKEQADFKSWIDKLKTALDGDVAGHMQNEIDKLNSKVADARVLSFTGKMVAVSAWASDSTYTDFPYRAAVACEGVTGKHFAQVVFLPEEALSGSFAPVAVSFPGGVYIYASEIPAKAIELPSILCIPTGPDNGSSGGSEAEIYTGTYQITPNYEQQELETAGMLMQRNIVADPIPIASTGNDAGGNTIIIGG